MAEDVTLSDPLKKVIKVTDNLSWDRDLLGNIRKENPNLNINEDNEVETVSVKGKDYFLFLTLLGLPNVDIARGGAIQQKIVNP